MIKRALSEELGSGQERNLPVFWVKANTVECCVAKREEEEIRGKCEGEL